MYTSYVYLIKSQRRLVILNQEVKDSDYLQITSFKSTDPDAAFNGGKAFCLGFLFAFTSGINVVNTIQEFQ